MVANYDSCCSCWYCFRLPAFGDAPYMEEMRGFMECIDTKVHALAEGALDVKCCNTLITCNSYEMMFCCGFDVKCYQITPSCCASCVCVKESDLSTFVHCCGADTIRCGHTYCATPQFNTGLYTGGNICYTGACGLNFYDGCGVTLSVCPTCQLTGLGSPACGLDAVPLCFLQACVSSCSGSYLTKCGNLSDLNDAACGRSNLGLGVIATCGSIDISSNTNLSASNGVCLIGDALCGVACEINHNALYNYVADEHRCICDGTCGANSMFSGCYIINNYYTKTQLSTCGQSNVHWGNITNHTHASEHISSGTDVICHDQLCGFSGCGHDCITAHIQSTSNPHSVTQSQIGLSAVTNDAQLKRSCNDWTGFGEKASPSDGDYLLVEDSLNSFRKCYVLMCNMPTCVASTRVKICAGDTTADYLCAKIKAGGVISCAINAGGGNNYICFTVSATEANTPSTLVCRDGSGNFCGGTITATLTGTATSAGNATTATNLCVATYCYDGNSGRPTMRASYADSAGSAPVGLATGLCNGTYNYCTGSVIVNAAAACSAGSATTATCATCAFCAYCGGSGAGAIAFRVCNLQDAPALISGSDVGPAAYFLTCCTTGAFPTVKVCSVSTNSGLHCLLQLDGTTTGSACTQALTATARHKGIYMAVTAPTNQGDYAFYGCSCWKDTFLPGNVRCAVFGCFHACLNGASTGCVYGGQFCVNGEVNCVSSTLCLYGVAGFATGTQTNGVINAIGVFGCGNTGVYGVGSTGHGVYGYTTSSGGGVAGVIGVASNAAAYALYGQHNDTGYGLYATTISGTVSAYIDKCLCVQCTAYAGCFRPGTGYYSTDASAGITAQITVCNTGVGGCNTLSWKNGLLVSCT